MLPINGICSDFIRVPENCILKEDNLIQWVYGCDSSENTIPFNLNSAMIPCPQNGDGGSINEEIIHKITELKGKQYLRLLHGFLFSNCVKKKNT